MKLNPEHLEVDESERSWIVPIEYPDGKVIKVLIPIPGEYWFDPADNTCWGLNLVCSGHYT